MLEAVEVVHVSWTVLPMLLVGVVGLVSLVFVGAGVADDSPKGFPAIYVVVPVAIGLAGLAMMTSGIEWAGRRSKRDRTQRIGRALWQSQRQPATCVARSIRGAVDSSVARIEAQATAGQRAEPFAAGAVAGVFPQAGDVAHAGVAEELDAHITAPPGSAGAARDRVEDFARATRVDGGRVLMLVGASRATRNSDGDQGEPREAMGGAQRLVRAIHGST